MELEIFFVPDIGSGLLRVILTVINLALILGGITLSAYSAIFIIRRVRKIDDKPVKKLSFFIAWVISAIVTAIIVWLSIFSSKDIQVPQISSDILSNNEVYRLIIDIINPVLDVKSIASSPIPYFFGLNLIARVFILYAFIASTLYISKMVKRLAKWFSEFLDSKFFNESEDMPDEDSENNSGEDSENNSDKNSENKDDKADLSSKKAFNKILKYLLPGTGGVGLLAYIFGTSDIRDGISEILDEVNKFLNAVTLNSKIEPKVTGISMFISNFLFMVLNIFILAVYVAIGIMFCIFLHAVWSNRVEIKKWILSKKRLLWTCVGITALVVIAGLVLFIAGSGFDDIKRVFDSIFKDGSNGLFQVLVYFALFTLALCIFCFLFAFLISFVIFMTHFAFHVTNSLFNVISLNTKESDKDVKITKLIKAARVIAYIIIGIFLLIIIFMGYEPIRDRLNDIFYPNNRFSYEPFRVLSFILLLGICIPLSLMMISVMASFIIWSVVKLFNKKGKKLADDLSVILEKLFFQIFKVLTIIPFILNHALIAVKTSIATMLKIFNGYEKESDKNKAVFLAACFASLASLLNTFYGIYGFYKDKSNIIPAVCSFAIAFAVQLAMLIFGMKAGEGIAERIITNSWHLKGGIWRAIISKLFYCCIYGFVYYAVYEITRYLLRDGKNTIKMNGVWINIITGAGLAMLIYAITLQIIELVKLIIKLIKKKYKAAENTEVSNVSSLPFNYKPIRIPYYLYLIAYLLLMVVSTGFAFNNLFGFYVNNAKLHERVYDQVRYEADKKLDLFGMLGNLSDDYTSNATELLSIIEQRAANAKKIQIQKFKELDDLVLEENKSPHLNDKGETSVLWQLQKNRNNYNLAISDLEEIVSAIKTYLNINYEAIDSNTEILLYTYVHYYRVERDPVYTTKSFNIGGFVVGKEMQNNNIMNRVSRHGGGYNKLPPGRRKDSDNDDQSIIVITKTISHVDKYTILRELFNYYEELERIIFSNDTKSGKLEKSQDVTGSDDEDIKSEIFYTLLDRNAQIDSVRKNIAELYRSMSQSEDIITIMDLPRIVDKILNSDSQNPKNMPQEDSPDSTENSELSNTKETKKYTEFNNYIEMALSVYNILAAYDTESNKVINEPTSFWLRALRLLFKQSDEIPISLSAYQVQQYRNYAQGITYSDFLISYDALLAGTLGLNPVKKPIDALYSSRAVAAFIFLICLLVDFMAYFAGLLLFKDIYLIGKSSKLSELGYVNYETALTNLFSLPKDKSGEILQLTFIYLLLYGDASDSDKPEALLDTSELHKLIKSQDFIKYYENGIAILNELGIFEISNDDSNSPNCSFASLRLWLDSFVKNNNITFNILFPEIKPNDKTDDVIKRYTDDEDIIDEVIDHYTDDEDIIDEVIDHYTNDEDIIDEVIDNYNVDEDNSGV